MRSGAYAFGPAGPAQPLSSSQIPKTTVFSGSLVTEAYQVLYLFKYIYIYIYVIYFYLGFPL